MHIIIEEKFFYLNQVQLITFESTEISYLNPASNNQI
jgi:hypothetical protein